MQGYHVDPLIGALGRQDHGNQQLIGIVEVKFRFGIGGMLAEPGNYIIITLFPGH